jgi:hypothetical protein
MKNDITIVERAATLAPIVKDAAELGLELGLGLGLGVSAPVELGVRTFIKNFWPLLQWLSTVQMK